MVWLFAIILFIDRLTKAVVVTKPNLRLNLLSDKFQFLQAINNQGPLGILIPNGFLIGGGVVVMCGLITMLIYEDSKKIKGGLLMIFGGVLSNTVDRFLHSHVIDVFRISPGLIFNIADLMIVGGVLWVGYLYVSSKKYAV